MKRSIPRAVGAVLLGLTLAVIIRIGFPQFGSPTPSGEFQLQSLGTETPPAWRLERVDGGYLQSSDLKGNVALLYFWATW